MRFFPGRGFSKACAGCLLAAIGALGPLVAPAQDGTIGELTPADKVARSRMVYQQGLAAFQKADTASFVQLLDEAVAYRPDHPTLIYNAACAHAIRRDTEPAFAYLERIASMGLVADPAEDPDLGLLPRRERWLQMLERVEENGRPVVHSTPAFSLADSTLLTEGIAHDPASGSFFVSSIRERKIVQVLPGGSTQDFGEDGTLWSVFALAVETGEHSRLWACTAALANTPGVGTDDVGRSGVRIYDVASGTLLRSVDLPVDGRHHVLNDLTLSPDGTAYLSDNQTGDLFRLAPQDTSLEKVPTGMQLLSPQGIVSSDDGSALYVADYSIGLVRIDLAGESGEALSPIEATSLLGIDGLVRHGHDLIAIQNGVRPHRVLRIELSDDGRTITDVSVLEAAHPEYDEPTLGVLVDDDLYYIANSQWGSLAEDGSVSSGYPVHEPVVLRLPL